MNNKQKVRAAWERAELCPCPFNGRFNTSLGGPRFTKSNPGECDTEAEAWDAAWQFTEARLEEIRQLREEIDAHLYRVRRCEFGLWMEWINDPKGAHISQADYIVREVRQYVREVRILSRLESALAEKTAGMCAEAINGK